MMVMNRRERVAWWFSPILILLLSPTDGMSTTREIRISDGQVEALNYLLGFVGRHREDLRQFNSAKIEPILQFLASPKEDGTLYHADGPDGTPSSYFEVDVARRLDQMLRLTDNPDIPAVFTAPSTVRLAHWEEIDTHDHRLPRLWEHLPQLPSAVSFTGIEHLVNTPDQSTGAYYDYDLHRSLLLIKANGSNLLISLSKQTGISSVGKKGLIIGRDDQWDYLYTGEPGLNRTGLGWVDSYMYDSYSVALYLDKATEGSVRFGVFKWLRAGWSNINLVRRAHIYDGLRRFAVALKQVLEHFRVADTPLLTRNLLEIRRLSENQLREIVQTYLNALRGQAEAERLSSAGEVKTLLNDQRYLGAMGREEMQSIAVLEYLKQLLGKQHHVNVKQRLPELQP